MTGVTRSEMSMKIVRVGAARLVMTMMRPCFSRMNRRLVSPGGAVMQTGLENTRPGNAFVGTQPQVVCAFAVTAAMNTATAPKNVLASLISFISWLDCGKMSKVAAKYL